MIPQRLELPSGVSRISTLAAGWGHSVLVADDGSLVVWGSNRAGQLGIGEQLRFFI